MKAELTERLKGLSQEGSRAEADRWMRDEGFSVRWVSSAEQIFSALWSLCFPPPLEGKWWYSALDRSGLESQFTFAYAVIERGGEPIGIAPTFLMDVRMDLVAPPFIARCLSILGKFIPRICYMQTLFIGSPCSDHGTVGLAPGYRLAEVAAILHDALWARAYEVGARVIAYKDFPETDSGAFDSLCARRGLSKMISYPGTSLPLTGDRFEGYLLTLNSSRRYKLRKKLSRSKEVIKLCAEIVQHPDPALVEEIFGLYRQTYQKGKTKFERMTPQFFRLMVDEDVCYFVLLRHCETAKLVAFMLCLHVGSRIISKFVGLDYGLENKAFLYFRLYEAAINWACRTGAREFCSGQTSYSAKLELGHTLVPFNNYFEYRNPLLHRLVARVARSISWSSLDQDLKAYLVAHPQVLGRTMTRRVAF